MFNETSRAFNSMMSQAKRAIDRHNLRCVTQTRKMKNQIQLLWICLYVTWVTVVVGFILVAAR